METPKPAPKTLTQAEETVMQVIWDLESARVKDILAKLPSPRPAYNTVSTIVRILEKKKLVGHHPEGRGYRYYPLLSKKEYRRQSLRNLLGTYFGGSGQALVSQLLQDEKLSLEDLDQILKQNKSAS